MKNKSFISQIFSISFPITLYMLSQFALQFTDMAFVGHYSKDGLAAILNAMIPVYVCYTFFFAFSKGTTILITQNIGAGRFKKAGRFCESSFVGNQAVSFAFFLVWILLGKNILILMGTHDNIIDLSTAYIRIISFYLLFFGVEMSMRSFFEGIGFTLPIFLSAVIRICLNIVLDWLLIFGNLGFPELGIEGAALASLISLFTGSIVLFVFMLANNRHFKITVKGIFHSKIRYFIRSFILGLPAGIELVVWSLGQMVQLMLLNRVQLLYIDRIQILYVSVGQNLLTSAFAIYDLLVRFSLSIYMGISVAAVNLVGRFTGAKDKKNVLRAGNTCTAIALAVCALTALLYLFCPRQIIGFFTPYSTIINKLSGLVFIIILISFPKSVNVIITNSIKSTGNTRWPLFTQLPGTISAVVLAYIFLFVLRLELPGLFLVIFMDELWRAAANYGKFILSAKDISINVLIRKVRILFSYGSPT
jgi:putative MATE family efflux protein